MTIPANPALPLITGTPTAGQILTATVGLWANAPTSYAVTWRRDSNATVGGGLTYVPIAADIGHYLDCLVTATNADGTSAGVASLPTSTVTSGGGGSTAFVIGQTLGSPARNNSSYNDGMVFTVGAAPITITDLGRWVIAGNVQDHQIDLIRASDKVLLGSATQLGAGAIAGQFNYAALSPTIMLAANTQYYLLFHKIAGGDQFYNDAGSVLTTTGVATIDASVWFDGTNYNLGTTAGQSFGPLSFKYQ